MAVKTVMLRKQLDTYNKRKATLKTRADELEEQVEAAAEVSPELEAQVNQVSEEMNNVETKINELVEAITAQEEATADAIEAAIDADPNDPGVSPDVLASVRPASRKRSSAEFQRRAAEFQRTGRNTYKDVRSLVRAAVLTSSTGVVGPTGVGGINDAVGAQGALLDMITLTDCTGMSSYRVAYLANDTAAASAITEGSVPTEGEPGFGYVELTPSTYGTIGYVSKEIRKQTPLQYEEKVRAQAAKSLRSKLNSIAVTNILASSLNTTFALTGASGKALFNETLLSDIILSYGGDEGVEGNAVLYLNKSDLKAFAAVRGKNEYLPVYTILPDSENPNTGVIKDNAGLSCRYSLNKAVTALSTLTLTATAQKTMFYGNPKCAELGLWGGYEVEVNDGYKFGEGLLTVRGEVTGDVDVTVKDGFVVVTGKTA